MNDECLICGLPLEYLAQDTEMECAICHRKEASKTRCRNGHYVCNDCHTRGLDAIIGICLSQRSKDPIEILRTLMDLPVVNMHGPEHHILVGSALLTACKNAGADLDLHSALNEMFSRGKKVPGGACGFWGSCGAAISSGMFLSILTGATPLSQESWGLANSMTAASLQAIGAVGGPRCCKRNSYLAITQAVQFVKEHLGIAMELPEIQCTHFDRNNQCIAHRCPFHP